MCVSWHAIDITPLYMKTTSYLFYPFSVKFEYLSHNTIWFATYATPVSKMTDDSIVAKDEEE